MPNRTWRPTLLIEAYRGRLDLAAIAGADDLAVPALVVAREHAILLAHVRRTGTPRGAHDLVVAATARATGRAVLATDARARFGDLPGVTARLLAS